MSSKSLFVARRREAFVEREPNESQLNLETFVEREPQVERRARARRHGSDGVYVFLSRREHHQSTSSRRHATKKRRVVVVVEKV
jgi:hypothetical protein